MHATRHIATATIINSPIRRSGDRVSLTMDLGSWQLLGAAMLVTALFAATVVSANLSAAVAWRIRDARTELRQLTDERTELVARIAALDDRDTLLELAERSGMTAATSVRYLVEEGPHTAAR